MTEEETRSSDDAPGSGRLVLIAVIVIAVIAGIVAVIALSGDDADEAADSVEVDQTPPATGTAEPTATEPAGTEPVGTEPPGTEPPATEPPATEPPATEPPATDPPEQPKNLRFTIDGIDDGGTIPQRFTCDGPNDVPILTVNVVPKDAQQLALIVDDPDAPGMPFVHWVIYGIAPATTEISDGQPEFTYGLNDVQLLDWFGPCPPPGDGPHEYIFTLTALTDALVLDPGLDGRQLASAIEGVTLSSAELRASYER